MTTPALAGIGTLPGWNFPLLLLLAKATIILVAALGITMAMQRASATARHLVWLVALGTLLLVPALTGWSPIRLAVLPAAPHAPEISTTPRQSPRDGAQNARVVNGTSVIDFSASPPTPATSTIPAPPTRGPLLESIASMSPVTLALSIWGVVLLGIILTLAWAGMSVRRIVRGARPLESSDWLNPLFEIADRIGLEDAPRLLRSEEAKMPFACGILAPTVVLPAESDGWTLDRRRAVLLHELAHVRRHDLIGHTLGRLACAVYWFHPLVWTAAKRLRSESERACDDLALACGTRATDYAEHLLDIVTSVRGDSTPLVALAMARRKEFEGRMLAILDPQLQHSTPSRRQSAALIGSLALIAITVGAIAPVSRTADAATVTAARPDTRDISTPMAVPLADPIPRDQPIPARLRAPAYPDSGVRGVTSLRYEKSSRISTVTSMSQSTAQGVAEASASASSSAASSDNADVALSAIAKAGKEFGARVASSVVQSLGLDGNAKGSKGPKGAKGSKGASDDRPVLLAHVLKSDTSASLRRIAAWGLQEYADTPVAMDALSEAVRRDTDWKVREMAAWALGDGDSGSAAVPALLSALKSDANERVRATAAWALGNRDDESAVDGLTAALADAAADVRTRAVWAIGSISPKRAPKALVAMLGDKDAHVRTVAAWALFTIEDPSAAPAIESALKVEQDKDVQLALIRAVAVLGEQSVNALRGLLESPDPRVKAMAVHALAGGRATGPWPWPWPQPRPFP
ncbi:MAG: M56 family metallopeptidase [bacterium]